VSLSLLVQTPPTDAEFLAIFNRLAVAFREAQDDSGITQGVYFEALHDLPMATLESGAVALMRESGQRFFPTTVEWRAAAEAAQIAHLKQAVRPARAEPWRVDCEACQDTGWTTYDCDGSPLCGRAKTHHAHAYVQPCPCRPTNRTWMRHQTFGVGAS
jgi:hypothetical protein